MFSLIFFIVLSFFRNFMVAFDNSAIFWSEKQRQNQYKQCLIYSKHLSPMIIAGNQSFPLFYLFTIWVLTKWLRYAKKDINGALSKWRAGTCAYMAHGKNETFEGKHLLAPFSSGHSIWTKSMHRQHTIDSPRSKLQDREIMLTWNEELFEQDWKNKYPSIPIPNAK